MIVPPRLGRATHDAMFQCHRELPQRCLAVAARPASSIIANEMNVTVNGETRNLPDGTTVRQLVAQFKLAPEKVAIELNRRLVRSGQYDAPLHEADEIEIVTFVGGG